MLFTQIEFLFFFAIVILFAWVSRERQTRHAVLLVASYYFYAYWDYRFCGLLLLSTVVDFWVATHLHRAESTRGRRGWLCVSLGVNLGVLGLFKYFNFFIDSAAPLLQSLGLGTSSLSIVLPVGISFYTFQTLSYTIDVYRGVLRPVDRWIDFALYVSFFPQLVAGPIVRAREFLPQLAFVPTWSSRRFYAGGQQMLRGAFKKVILADRLAEMVDVVFAGPELYSGLTILIAVVAYAGQIYYDFSGYSDMAIGAAKMLGYRFPVNFRHPYLATSLSDFWRRWHMTLSRWLRDYLYISLGGSRRGTARTYLNLLLTMLLGGLWHGAAWTFVLWGAWHGIALAIERWWQDQRSRGLQGSMGNGYSVLKRLLGGSLTLLIVLVGWVLFRSESISQTTVLLKRIVTLSDGINWFPPLALLAVGCLVLEHLAWRTRLRRAMRLPYAAWYSPVFTAILIWVLLLYAPRGFRPFVYFQF